MATEVLPASPRISFSDDHIPTAAGENQRRDVCLPLDPGSGDFNFTIGFHSAINGSSDAGDLFSDGKILPFFKTPSPFPPPILDQRRSIRQIPKPRASSGDHDARSTSYGRRQSIWRFGRSSSVGSADSPAPISPSPLHRSQSTGSFPHLSHQPRPAGAGAGGGSNVVSNRKIPAGDSNSRKTYYYSGSQRSSQRGGVRITPVLNVPSPLISRSSSGSSTGSSTAVTGIFTYLLCNCGTE